jgi:hypothetical protein
LDARPGTNRLVVAAASTEEEEDLMQIKDRDQWYVARFCADDAPDWNPGRFVQSKQLAPNTKLVVLDAEISREKVPLRNAYKHVGQRARVRVNSGVEHELTGAPPCPGQDRRRGRNPARMCLSAVSAQRSLRAMASWSGVILFV